MQDKFWLSPKIVSLPQKWPMLYLITDDTRRQPQEMAAIISRAIGGGVNCVQFREKSLSGDDASRAFSAVAEVCTNRNVPLLINGDLIGRFDIKASFAGFHFNQRTLPRFAPSLPFIAGYSAHSVPEADSAFTGGISFCTISPVFATPSKAGLLEPLGISALEEACRALPCQKLIALGGINTSNISAVMRAGAAGVALIRDIWQADDPEATARQLRTMMEIYANPMNNFADQGL